MARAVVLSNGRQWPSKKAAKEHFKLMLARYGDGETISNISDHGDLIALLERFDMFVAGGLPKIGAGIERFERRLNKGEGWSSSGFWAVRVDGTATDFSYVKAVDGTPTPLSQEFYDACHNAVSRDLLSMKQKQFDHFANADGQLECDVTGKMITFAEAHLSHAHPPFGSIVNDFRRQKGWETSVPVSILTMAGDKQISTHFTDDRHASEFRRLHHKVATLRIVSKGHSGGSVVMAGSVKRPLRFT